MKVKRFIIGTLACSFVTALFGIVRPAFAQGIVEQIRDFIAEKAGFRFDTESDEFVYSRLTPNYEAFAGDVKTGGGHRFRLLRDGSALDLTLTSVGFTGTPSAVLAATTEISSKEWEILINAETILTRIASDSATLVTDTERVTIDAAKTIVERVQPSTGSSELSQQNQDFLLLVKLKSLKVLEQSKAVETLIADVAKDVGTLVSKATLVDSSNARTVQFKSIRTGLDFVYRLNKGSIVQDIQLVSRDNLYSIFTFSLQSPGLLSADVGHGVWYFRKNNIDLFRIPKGWATDASGAFTNDVEVVMRAIDGGDEMTITVPADWLTSAERQFPVTVTIQVEVVPELRNDVLGAPSSTATESGTAL